jgi:hypothetical protein
VSKRIVISVLASLAMSFGGWLVSCGSGGESNARQPVIVQLPENCTLLSPQDSLGAMTSGTPVINVKPGLVHFVVDDNGRQVEFDEQISAEQHQITIQESDLR